MDKVASLAVHTLPLLHIISAFLGFVFGVGLLVFAQLVGPMGEFAILLVRAKAKLQVFLAELRFLFVFLDGRFIGIGSLMVSG